MNGTEKLLLVAFAGGVLLMSDRKKGSVSASVVRKLAEAIARQEGFYVTGSVPARLHNPGDLTIDTTGKGIGQVGIYVLYANDADGWEALHRQVEKMLSGESHVYSPDMTLRQVATKYTSTERDYWAANVASFLGVTMDTKLSELV